MKRTFRALALAICGLLLAGSIAQAQQLQFWRPYDQRGVNVFETPKTDTVPFHGLFSRYGGAFAADYQMLSHENYVTNSSGILTLPSWESKFTKIDSANQLIALTNGFNLSMATGYLDAQLADGIRVNLTLYLASRHHQESWVKNGYLQIDKAKFLGSDLIDNLFKYMTIKVGQVEVNYGDQHFRRADGGNQMYNPFVENYIMDEFATEMGAEVYFQDPSGFLAMVGATNGMLNPTVKKALVIDSSTGDTNSYNPAYYVKLGFDKQINPDLRVRLTGSYYTESSTASSTLFGGDRTGSHYFAVVHTLSQGDLTANPFSGRFNPGFSEAVSTFMINPFVKFMGAELFATYEAAQGRKVFEKDNRKATQLAVDLLYRFGNTEQFWVGGRYNTVKADWTPTSAANLAAIKDPAGKTGPGTLPQVTINRMVVSAGWYMTQNVMMKLEYVSQEYKDYPGETLPTYASLPASQFGGAKFNGLMIEAAIGF
jgi:hypothetical protein